MYQVHSDKVYQVIQKQYRLLHLLEKQLHLKVNCNQHFRFLIEFYLNYYLLECQF